MWWNDNKETKAWMSNLSDRLCVIDEYLRGTLQDAGESLSRLHDKADALLNDAVTITQVSLAEKTLDKFDDYMRNVDKLNTMINELKGCVAVCRGTMADRKALVDMAFLFKQFSQKIDYINENMKKCADFMRKCEKKSPKKKKVASKTVDSENKKPIKKKKAAAVVLDSLSE